MITGAAVEIDYTNYRGRRSGRVVFPLHIWFGSDEYHADPQWLLDAFDVEKGAMRTFAMKDVHSWMPRPEVEASSGEIEAIREAGGEFP
jgi:predicted DNA-binding transcriptional regulator YafY